MTNTGTANEARLMKYRTADAIVCLVVMTFVTGLFTALVFAAMLLLSARLRKFRLLLPKSLYDEYGDPTFMAENILPVALLATAALILMFLGHSIAGILLGIMAVLDFIRNRVDLLSLINSYRRRE